MVAGALNVFQSVGQVQSDESFEPTCCLLGVADQQD